MAQLFRESLQAGHHPGFVAAGSVDVKDTGFGGAIQQGNDFARLLDGDLRVRFRELEVSSHCGTKLALDGLVVDTLALAGARLFFSGFCFRHTTT